MREDEEGFRYPVVDTSLCSNCGLCESVCPVINRGEPRRPIVVYASKNRDEEMRRRSSSGGVFMLLAKQTIAEGGVVFGAKFDADWRVVHDFAETVEEAEAFYCCLYAWPYDRRASGVARCAQSENGPRSTILYLVLRPSADYRGVACNIPRCRLCADRLISRHGFSILNHKPFVTLVHRGRGRSRLDSLLGRLGLTERLADDAAQVDIEAMLATPDYEAVEALLDKAREASKSFLIDSLACDAK